MGVTAIGFDLIKIARFARMTPHFISRVFTEGERAYILEKNAATAAGLFAAKEAVAKALGTGFRGFWPADIEIWHDGMGKPHVRLFNGALKRARQIAGRERSRKNARRKRVQILVSISHTDSDAVAFAVMV